jgi:endonuclease/exonuclease/phosphatase family metal-dependent hydrolase
VQDLFDDHNDHRTAPGDKEADSLFAEHPQILQAKLDHLSEALLKMNDGKGPDILAIAEVENTRAAELLQKTLNDQLPAETPPYGAPLMKEVWAGRHIAPAILTRLPLVRDRTRLLGKKLRILEGHIKVNDHDLVIIASHWTSRLTDKTGSQREKYGNQIFGTFKGMYMSNPNVDVVVCGDFNDQPGAPSVTEHLHAVGDPKTVLHSTRQEPYLLNLFAGKDPQQWGTHYYRHDHTWFIFDQIAVSPGMLDDQGWSCDPATAQAVQRYSADPQRHPFGFTRDGHGYSDHFPVTARLKVH